MEALCWRSRRNWARSSTWSCGRSRCDDAPRRSRCWGRGSSIPGPSRWTAGSCHGPRRPATRVLILPTASAAEGDDVFDMWARKGWSSTTTRSGSTPRCSTLKTREDAVAPGVRGGARRGRGRLLLGGQPRLPRRRSSPTRPFWEALLAAVDRGMAYAGCSAGVACLGDIAPDSARAEFDEDLWQPGLRLFPGFWFGPHWDALDGFAPGLDRLHRLRGARGRPRSSASTRTRRWWATATPGRWPAWGGCTS